MTRRALSISVISLSLLIISILWFALSTENQTPAQIYPATINRDCAPWDGSAFTVSIPMQGARISISIYQSPDIKYQTTFSFPDESGQTGNAFLLQNQILAEQLNGKVSFRRVEEENQVEGTIDLITNAGEHFKGEFIAEWKNEIVYCG
jgi:hypothetical protein